MKTALKSCAYALCRVLALPAVLLYGLLIPLLGRKEAFAAMSQGMSLWPGIPGNYLRWGFYKWTLASLGKDAFICFGTLLSHPDTRIGEGAYIGPQGNLGLCEIGAHTLLGSGVHVISGFQQHDFSRVDEPIKHQGGHLHSITIGEDCWIGNLSVVGAPVGPHTVVGAGSAVIRELPAYAIAVGHPAKVIRDRRQSEDKTLDL